MNESSVSRTVHPPLKIEIKKQLAEKRLKINENELPDDKKHLHQE